MDSYITVSKLSYLYSYINHHTGDFIVHKGFCLLNTWHALRDLLEKEHNLFSCAMVFHESGSRTKHNVLF